MRPWKAFIGRFAICSPTGPAFGTDAPYLDGWGQPLLYGPGSIRDAHTAHEKLEQSSFERAVEDYERTARELLAGVDAAP